MYHNLKLEIEPPDGKSLTLDASLQSGAYLSNHFSGVTSQGSLRDLVISSSDTDGASIYAARDAAGYDKGDLEDPADERPVVDLGKERAKLSPLEVQARDSMEYDALHPSLSAYDATNDEEELPPPNLAYVRRFLDNTLYVVPADEQKPQATNEDEVPGELDEEFLRAA